MKDIRPFMSSLKVHCFFEACNRRLKTFSKRTGIVNRVGIYCSLYVDRLVEGSCSYGVRTIPRESEAAVRDGLLLASSEFHDLSLAVSDRSHPEEDC